MLTGRRELGLPIEYRNWRDEGGTPQDFVVGRNLHRRHLNSSQRAAIAVNMLPHLKQQAKDRQTAQGNRGNEGGRGNGKTSPAARACPPAMPTSLASTKSVVAA